MGNKPIQLITPASPAGRQSDQSDQSNSSQNSSGVGTGSINKELEVGGIRSGETPPLKDIGTHEVELTHEVASVGVKVQPTSVALPQNVQQLGVKPSGPTTPVASGSTVTLPLTDDQIAKGLHQSITSSWRWLAEWCVRKIKQLHSGLTGNKK
ncbi:hypothetical protein HY409_03970 [Candidatus Gottesmanbacteria bacterium]|nr:hypothetical protein [Candidatus Gottesmanbacteria bacterium]